MQKVVGFFSKPENLFVLTLLIGLFTGTYKVVSKASNHNNSLYQRVSSPICFYLRLFGYVYTLPWIGSLLISGGNDVTASIDKDFAERIEEKRQHNFELYNQDDPLLGEKVVKTKRTVPVQDKPSVMKKLEAAKNVNTQKEARIAEAVRQMQAGGRTSNTDKVIQKTPKVKPQKLRR